MPIAAIAAAVGLLAAARLVYPKVADCCAYRDTRALNRLALAGVLHYLALLGLVTVGSNLAAFLAVAGCSVSVVLLATMASQRKWCPWCLLSAAASFAALLALGNGWSL